MINFNKLSKKSKREVAEWYLYGGNCHAIARPKGRGYELKSIRTLDEMPDGWELVESVSREELESHLV